MECHDSQSNIGFIAVIIYVSFQTFSTSFYFRVPLQSLDQAPLEALLSFMASASANLEQHITVCPFLFHRIHVLVYLHYLLRLNGVFTYIYHKHQLHVDRYSKYTYHTWVLWFWFFLMDLHPDSQTNLSLNHLMFLCEFSVPILYPFENNWTYVCISMQDILYVQVYNMMVSFQHLQVIMKIPDHTWMHVDYTCYECYIHIYIYRVSYSILYSLKIRCFQSLHI